MKPTRDPRPDIDRLFRRIGAARPNPVRLRPKELLALEAWLDAYRRHVTTRFSELQRAARGDAELRTKHEAARAWHQHLDFVVTYNRGLESMQDLGRARSRLGRPPLTKAEQRARVALVERWNRAKAAGVQRKAFCREEDITLKYLATSINWAAQRKRRANGAAGA